MGFDSWGPTQRPNPPRPVTDTAATADLEARQRTDDRRLLDRNPASDVQMEGTRGQSSTVTLAVGESETFTWDLPSSSSWYQATVVLWALASATATGKVVWSIDSAGSPVLQTPITDPSDTTISASSASFTVNAGVSVDILVTNSTDQSVDVSVKYSAK